MSVKPLLVAQDLTIGYHNVQVASGLHLELFAGEVLCLLGPNGVGKSTLFKSLMGLVPLQAGQVWIDNQTLASWRPKELAKRVAYVPQASSGVLMGRTAHRSLFAPPSPDDYELAAQALQQLGISHLTHRLYNQLSGGEQQLVLLARALAQQAQLLILDEPTASLDFGNQILVLETIAALRQQGLAIFVCTHQPEHAHRMADRVLMLKAGQSLAYGRTGEVLTTERLAEMYNLSVEQVQAQLKGGLNL